MSTTFGPVTQFQEMGGEYAVGETVYRVVQRDGRTYQQRFERGPGGLPLRLFELEATHAIGSGKHARTYLHLSPAGELVELPLTWYSQEKRWAMSPGYDRANNAGFTRTVDAGCLFCHMAYPDGGQPRFGIRSVWQAPSLEHGVNCERCHGPGGRHAAIVNPARLSKELALDVCLQCHLQTTSENLPHALRRFGRDAFSFRPGEHLQDYAVQFDHPAGTRTDKFEANSAGYRLMQSACFLKSAGRLTCTTCHNPHEERQVSSEPCLGCHAPHADANKTDCLGCHMPKRRAEDAVHVVLTDHRIQRNPAKRDALAARAESHVEYRGDIRFLQPDLLPAERSLYRGLALVTDGADLPKGLELLRHAFAAVKNPPVEARVGFARALAASAKNVEAAAQCRAALQTNPGLSSVRAECAKVLEAMGKKVDALQEYRLALAADAESPAAAFGIAGLTPDLKEAANMYRLAARSVALRADALSNLGNLLASSTILEEAIACDPRLAAAENNLARVDGMQGRIATALQHVERALALDPKFIDARFNHAQLLQAMERVPEAVGEYREAIRLRPGFVEAHLALGNALGDEGKLEAAIAEFQAVLRLAPQNTEAREKLTMALDMLKGR